MVINYPIWFSYYFNFYSYPILSPTLALTKVEQDILPELPSEDFHEQSKILAFDMDQGKLNLKEYKNTKTRAVFLIPKVWIKFVTYTKMIKLVGKKERNKNLLEGPCTILLSSTIWDGKSIRNLWISIKNLLHRSMPPPTTELHTRKLAGSFTLWKEIFCAPERNKEVLKSLSLPPWKFTEFPMSQSSNESIRIDASRA